MPWKRSQSGFEFSGSLAPFAEKLEARYVSSSSATKVLLSKEEFFFIAAASSSERAKAIWSKGWFSKSKIAALDALLSSRQVGPGLDITYIFNILDAVADGLEAGEKDSFIFKDLPEAIQNYTVAKMNSAGETLLAQIYANPTQARGWPTAIAEVYLSRRLLISFPVFFGKTAELGATKSLAKATRPDAPVVIKLTPWLSPGRDGLPSNAMAIVEYLSSIGEIEAAKRLAEEVATTMK